MEKNLDSLKHKIEEVNRLATNESRKKQIIKVFDDTEFNYDKFIQALASYLKNFNVIVESSEDHLSSVIEKALDYFINSTQSDAIITVNKINILDSINTLIEYAPMTNNLISLEEFEKRYKLVVSQLIDYRLNKPSNLKLYTKEKKTYFEVYKNSNNSIYTRSERKELTFPIKELIRHYYNNKPSSEAEYADILVEKIVDNTIFDLIDNDSNQLEVDVKTRMHLLEEAKGILHSKVNIIDASLQKEREKVDELTKLVNEATNVKNAYEIDLKLKKSYEYWEAQAKTYADKYRFHIRFSIGLAILLVLAVFLYLKSATVSTSINTNNVSDILKLGFLVFSTTISIWFIKILVKLALSNYHLATDANERVIMIKTYVAFLNEGNGYPKEDKSVILNNIFRPTNFGIIKDETSVTLIDVISALKK